MITNFAKTLVPEELTLNEQHDGAIVSFMKAFAPHIDPTADPDHPEVVIQPLSDGGWSYTLGALAIHRYGKRALVAFHGSIELVPNYVRDALVDLTDLTVFEYAP